MEKCTIVAHGDGDGVSSASLLKAYLESKGCTIEVYFSHPVGLLEDLKAFAQASSEVYIADIAVNELHAQELFALLEEMSKSKKVVYIDHHPLPEDYIRPSGIEWVYSTCCSASELTYHYLSKKNLDPEYARIALYGAIGDYLDETPWVREELMKWDKRSVYLEAGVLVQGLEGARRDYEFKRRVVNHLSKNALPSTMPELVEKSLKQAVEDENLRVWVKHNVVKYSVVAYVVNPPGSLGRAANYARIYGNARVGLALEERKEIYVSSLRGEPGVDLNRILRTLSRKLGISGGGHPSAAGARFKKELLQVFLEELASEVSRQATPR